MSHTNLIPLPYLATCSQISHPQRIRPRQQLRINRPTHRIHDRLICRYTSLGELGQTHRLLNHQLAIRRRSFPQRPRVRAAFMLLREPKDHFVAHEDTELLI